jgi:glycerol-3-phosphate cytidylyltransferase-like family protein
VLVYGSYDLLVPDHAQVYAYRRTLGTEEVVVTLNFSDTDTPVPHEEAFRDTEPTRLIGTHAETETAGPRAPLQPYEGRVDVLSR